MAKIRKRKLGKTAKNRKVKNKSKKIGNRKNKKTIRGGGGNIKEPMRMEH
jgi:hypothetical protein